MRGPLFAVLLSSIAALGVLSVPAVAQSEPSPSVTEQNDIVYATVDGEPILLDAFLPNTSVTHRPAIVLLHAGGWSVGDK